jgi:hypothetical protein
MMRDIEFITTKPYLLDLPDTAPRPTKNFLPNWWKNLPKFDADTSVPTVKTCPSFPDFFSQGYVIPMWADTVLRFDKESQQWSWFSGRDGDYTEWGVHHSEQMTKHVDASFMGKDVVAIFKAACPWRIKTRPGWSVYQLPLFYHFDNDFAVMPGVIDTDIHSEINQQVMFFREKEEILIKRGTPFAQYIPFKRQKISHEVRKENKKDLTEFKKQDEKFFTTFSASGEYRRVQRERDKK